MAKLPSRSLGRTQRLPDGGLAPGDSEAPFQKLLEDFLLRGRYDLQEFVRALGDERLQLGDPLEGLGGRVLAHLAHQGQSHFQVGDQTITVQSLAQVSGGPIALASGAEVPQAFVADGLQLRLALG